MTINGIETMLSFDKHEEDKNLEKLGGVSHSNQSTHSVELKKNSYR